MPRHYFASLRDLPSTEPAPGVTQRLVQGDHVSVVIAELQPKTVVDTHKHEEERTGVVTRGSLVMVIAGEQRILNAGDTFRVPAGAAHGARVFEVPAQVIEVWAPPRETRPRRPAGRRATLV